MPAPPSGGSHGEPVPVRRGTGTTEGAGTAGAKEAAKGPSVAPSVVPKKNGPVPFSFPPKEERDDLRNRVHHPLFRRGRGGRARRDRCVRMRPDGRDQITRLLLFRWGGEILPTTRSGNILGAKGAPKKLFFFCLGDGPPRGRARGEGRKRGPSVREVSGRPWPSDPFPLRVYRFRIFPPRHGPTQENQPSGTERPGFKFPFPLAGKGFAALWRFRNERIEKHQSRAQRRLCFFRSRCAPPSLSLLEIGEAGESDAMEESRERPELPG